MSAPKYKTIFSSKLHSVVPKERDKYLALASLDKLKSFLPEIDIERDYDLLPFCANAAVVNKINKNADGITTQTALESFGTFVNRPTNLEHDRKIIVGCILNSGFSEYGTDKPLKAEDIKDLTKPFNLTVGGFIWKVVNKNLINYLEETNDPDSKLYNDASLSWECSFSEMDLVLFKDEGQKNIEDGRIILDPQEVEELSKYLRANDGSGKLPSGEYVYRLAKNLTFLGVGITTSPAANVKGILVGNEKELNKESGVIGNNVPALLKNGEYVISKTLEIAANNKINENKISQQENLIVTKHSKIMNIVKIEDITDESLKEIKASQIHEFVQKECAKISETWVKEKKAKEDEVKAALESNKTLTDSVNTLKAQSDILSKTLEKIQAETLEKEKVEKFNQRMAHFDSIYELDDDIRKILASQLKDVDEDGFKKVDESYKVLLKDKNKENIEAAKKKFVPFQKKNKDDGDPEDKKDKGADEDSEDKNGKKKAKASVEDALANADKEDTNLPNGTSTETPTLKERAEKAFAKGNIIIDCSKRRKI